MKSKASLKIKYFGSIESGAINVMSYVYVILAQNYIILVKNYVAAVEAEQALETYFDVVLNYILYLNIKT